MNSALQCQWSFSETVNYGMQQNHVPIIRQIVLANQTEDENRNLTVTITAEPAFAYEWSKSIDVLPAGQPIDLGIVNLQMSAQFLAELTERITGTLTLTVRSDNHLIHEERGAITVLAFDEWSGLAVLPEMTAAFVTPNHQHVASIVREAADILAKWTGSPSFTSYQSKSANQARIQAAAIYAALHNRNIAYCVAPPSFEQIGQRVRLPETIVAHRMGNCLDLSLLYAACLEAVGLHPLLVFTTGHAFTGVWLVEETFAESVQDDISLLTKRLAPGVNEICVMEATAFVEGSAASFDEAVSQAIAHLQNPDQFDCLVDIRRARAAAIRPLPIRTASGNGWVIEPAPASSSSSPSSAPEQLEELGKPIEVDQLQPGTKQKQWERRLLDMTLRNGLLNFRLTKSSVPIITAQLSDLEDALAEREEFQLLAKPSDWQDNARSAGLYQNVNSNHPLALLLREEFDRKRLRADLQASELDRRLIHLYRSARTSLEENGANTLFLALGLLKWYESPVSEAPRYAPIVLLPVDIIRRSSRQGYVIRARDEEPQINVTLLEMIKQDFGIGIGGLDPLPRDEKGIALKQVFNVFRHALIQVPRWDVEESACLGLFSFGQFVMWNDIRSRSEELAENRIVASLMAGKLQWQEAEDDAPALDQASPSSLAVPISADSSQLAAIQAAGSGESFVLHGPPGTGKSQTITNMIASALASGKKVLFVAEKMAALSVVQRRLEQIGLGPFCLELHSNKSTKKAVLDQLNAVLETARMMPPEGWNAQSDRLAALRDELNGYVEALHRKQHFGISLFEAIAGYEQAGQGPDSVQFNAAAIEALQPERWTAWRDLVSQMTTAGSQCGNPHGHALAELTLKNYTQPVKTEAENLLRQYAAHLSEGEAAFAQAADLLGISSAKAMSRQQTVLFTRICELLSRTPDIRPAFVQTPNLAETVAQVQAASAQGRQRDRLKAQVLTAFKPEVLKFDAQLTSSEWTKTELQWMLPRWLGQNRIAKLLRRMAAPGVTIAKTEVKNHLSAILDLQAEERTFREKGAANLPLLGPSLRTEEHGDWEAVDAACAWLLGLDRTLLEAFGAHGAAQTTTRLAELLANGPSGMQAHREQLLRAERAGQEVAADEEAIGRLLQADWSVLTAASGTEHWHSFMQGKAQQWSSHLDQLRDWSAWRRIRDQAVEAGLQPLVASYEEGRIATDEIEGAFDRGVYRACANFIIARNEQLGSFSGQLFEEAIKRFKEADQRFAELTRQEIAARLSARVPVITKEAAQSSEAGILQRAIRSGGRAMSIRKLFEGIPNLLSRLTPCMLMSPISVAQYLDPKHAKFDLVIFDEASQVPTAQAVGALARGTQAVIVGDPRQLPPTSFFSKSSGDAEDEEEVLQDMESILEDCLSLGMPQRHLTWHYRSRHESLIAFSNAHYYENKLMTFPSPDEPVSSVTWFPIEGYYDRGRTKQNRAEGEAVIAEIARRLKHPAKRQSMGVVTFSSIQQTLIEDMLDAAFAREPELEQLAAELPEPIFIKNLENVQGDERDVILFSVGYGPDASGKVNLNFGPLNREGGWRRLNVAVSRAREEMLVFSTLRAHHLQASRISAQGVLGLKSFLEYAEKGKHALPAGEQAKQIPLVSHVHRGVAEKLRQKGFETDLYVGTSGYRIDIGVRHPEQGGQYVLGILMDGPMYRNADTARDRDILREQVLRQLGWKLYRLWTPDWWENADKVAERIIAAIQHAANEQEQSVQNATLDSPKPSLLPWPTATTESAASPSATAATATVTPETATAALPEPTAESKQPYRPAALQKVDWGTDAFYASSNAGFILEQIRQVIQAEGPISRGLLAKRILQAWGIARLGAKLDQRFTELLQQVSETRTEREGTVYFWPAGVNPSEYAHFRVAEEDALRRTAEELPPEEIAAAVQYVLASQISLPQDELVKQVVKALGYARSGAALDKAVRAGIECALERGTVQTDDQHRIIMK
ncbi:DUF3320 domain-containing protein [Paenibacillus methanolicus]|uniref:AAA domain-containing protein n=1 Tax=Paenibacillus methanolicus TaxID=582686 RepID=A0A5S5BRN2_9BACL|nr:DUF3320 domain-containing protein [Paenibacillus methanolicus]TYP69637.1 AAA domain-containing protein [Paenibacillus methanolicus]